MKLSPVQQAIVDELAESPLAWIGSDSRYRPCVVCPADSSATHGTHMTDATRDALLRRGIIKHGELSAEHVAEYKRRRNLSSVRRSAPSHGYIFQRDAQETP